MVATRPPSPATPETPDFERVGDRRLLLLPLAVVAALGATPLPVPPLPPLPPPLLPLTDPALKTPPPAEDMEAMEEVELVEAQGTRIGGGFTATPVPPPTPGIVPYGDALADDCR